MFYMMLAQMAHTNYPHFNRFISHSIVQNYGIKAGDYMAENNLFVLGKNLAFLHNNRLSSIQFEVLMEFQYG
jgi:hypothetical protein